jgi:hypothetical protein
VSLYLTQLLLSVSQVARYDRGNADYAASVAALNAVSAVPVDMPNRPIASSPVPSGPGNRNGVEAVALDGGVHSHGRSDGGEAKEMKEEEEEEGEEEGEGEGREGEDKEGEGGGEGDEEEGEGEGGGEGDGDKEEEEHAKLFAFCDGQVNAPRESRDPLAAVERLSEEHARRPGQAGVLWRMARACRDAGANTTNLSEDEKKELMRQGLMHALHAIKVNNDCPDAHKWTVRDRVHCSMKLLLSDCSLRHSCRLCLQGIMYSMNLPYVSLKDKILNGYKVRSTSAFAFVGVRCTQCIIRDVSNALMSILDCRCASMWSGR